jgi:hypothetical protein
MIGFKIFASHCFHRSSFGRRQCETLELAFWQVEKKIQTFVFLRSLKNQEILMRLSKVLIELEFLQINGLRAYPQAFSFLN